MAKTTGIAPDLLGLAEVDRVVHEPARLIAVDDPDGLVWV